MKSKSLVPLTCAAIGCIAATACNSSETSPSGLAISVAPLSLPSLSRVCYDLRVTNGAGGAGDTVWSRGTPGLNGGSPDSDALCSDEFGNGASGDLTFVGACDASGQLDSDTSGERMNSVTLWLDGIYDTSAAYIDPNGANGWQNPCASGCTLDVLCEENADAIVEFNLTVLRQANQGFFDIGVNFDDIFCSAKLDTCYADNSHIQLLFGDDATRDWTAVFGFACTAGTGNAQTTLQYGKVEVVCGTTVFPIDTGKPKGNQTTTADGKTLHYGIYRGVEQLNCDDAATAPVESCNKVYWNLAFSLDDLTSAGGACQLAFLATATDGTGGFAAGLPTGSGRSYPYISVDTTLTPAACQRQALDASLGVRTAYRGTLGGLVAPTPMCTTSNGTTVATTGGSGCGQTSAPQSTPPVNPTDLVAFSSYSSNLVPGDTLGHDAFVKNIVTGAITRVSAGFGYGAWPSLDASGTKVAFISIHPTYGYQVYVKDLTTGNSVLASSKADGTMGASAPFERLRFSGNGNRVVTTWHASNLAPNDTNGGADIFVKDLLTNELLFASTSSSGVVGNAPSFYGSTNYDGRKVAFHSSASNLVANDTNSGTDVFIKDLDTGELIRVGAAGTGAQLSYPIIRPSLDDSGNLVAFIGGGSWLLGSATNEPYGVYVQNLTTRATVRASQTDTGVVATGSYHEIEISPDGTKVVFSNDSGVLVGNDTNATYDIFLKDLVTGLVTRVSTSLSGAAGNAASHTPMFTADSAKVVFESSASDLVTGDNNGERDVFVYTIATHQLMRASVAADGTEANSVSVLLGYW